MSGDLINKQTCLSIGHLVIKPLEIFLEYDAGHQGFSVVLPDYRKVPEVDTRSGEASRSLRFTNDPEWELQRARDATGKDYSDGGFFGLLVSLALAGQSTIRAHLPEKGCFIKIVDLLGPVIL